MQKARSNRDTFTAYHLDLSGGSQFCITQAVWLAFIEEITGKDSSSFFDLISAASGGTVNAGVIVIPDPEKPGRAKWRAKDLAQGWFVVLPRVFGSNSWHLAKQGVNHVLKARVMKDHFDHKIMSDTLEPFIGGTTTSQALKPILMAAHNMNKQEATWIGCVDSPLLDPKGLKSAPLLNGKTPIMSGIRAATAIPSVFEAFHEELTDSFYHDLSPFVTPAPTHLDLLRMIRMKQKSLHANQPVAKEHSMQDRMGTVFNIARRNIRRALVRFGKGDLKAGVSSLFNMHAAGLMRPINLNSTNQVVARSIHLGAGDTTNSIYDRNTAPTAGIFAHTDPSSYGGILTASTEVWQREMSMLFDQEEATRAVTGQPVCTIIDHNMVAATDDEKKSFPDRHPMAVSIDNLFKIYQFARNQYVLGNLDATLNLLKEITAEKYERREITLAEREEQMGRLNGVTRESAEKVLDGIIVTDKNADEIAKRFGHTRKGKQMIPDKKTAEIIPMPKKPESPVPAPSPVLVRSGASTPMAALAMAQHPRV